MVTAFIDTSTLFKKYADEKGDTELRDWFSRISEIYLSPTTNIELCSIIHRLHRENKISTKELYFIEEQMSEDRCFFEYILWIDEFDILGCLLAEKYSLKASDCIQLAAAILSKTEVFLTSDKQLFNAAQAELKNAVFI